MNEVQITPTNIEPEVPRDPKDKSYSRISHIGLDLGFNTQVDIKSFHGGSRRAPRSYKVAVWSLLAALIDSLLTIGLFLIFLFSFSLLVKKSFGVVLFELKDLNLIVIFYASAFFFALYSIMLRVFFGATLGESACALRLGWPYQMKQSSYSIKIIFRSLVILATGVLLFPILSLLTGVDWLGRLLNLPLIEDNYPRI